MPMNCLIFFLVFILLIFQNNLYGFQDALDEDLDLSKKIPLISGIPAKDILEKQKAAITVCTTPLNNYIDHVSLVFEIKHPERVEIDLFAVHFGGDGNSSNVEKGRPIIDNARDTLRKVYRGKETTLSAFDFIDPIYSRKVIFVVERDDAIKALKKVESDNGLNYNLASWSWGYNKKTYNCCTYVDKILRDVGIDINFNSYLKTAGSLLARCSSYKTRENQKMVSPTEYYNSLEFIEYKDSVTDLFKKGLKLKESNNYDESIKYILESGKKGHFIAQCFIGFCYHIYDNVKDVYYSRISKYSKILNNKKNNDESYYYSLISDYSGFSSCAHFKTKFNISDVQEAFKWVERSANKNFSRAASDLGYFYESGKGTKKDLKKAIEWYQKAADTGDIMAQHNLGKIYDYGRGVEKNKKEAVKWYQKAADQNDDEAQFNLGALYFHGQGVEKSYEEAMKWYRKAAEQNLDAAQNNLGALYFHGQGVEKSYEEAIKWFRKAAEQNLADAQFNLGNMYFNGQGVEKSYEEAIKWYRKAAKQNLADAQLILEKMYFNGQGVEKSYEEAAK